MRPLPHRRPDLVTGFQYEERDAPFVKLAGPGQADHDHRKVRRAPPVDPSRTTTTRLGGDRLRLARRSDTTISHHLKVLREAGLVAAERRASWVFYRARPALLRQLSALLAVEVPALA